MRRVSRGAQAEAALGFEFFEQRLRFGRLVELGVGVGQAPAEEKETSVIACAASATRRGG